MSTEGEIPIPETCSVKECEKESAYQIGFAFTAVGHPQGGRAECWTSLTECQEHAGLGRIEDLVPPESDVWGQFETMFQSVGKALPDRKSVILKRRGL